MPSIDNLTTAQRDTLRYFEGVARECGSSVEIAIEDDGTTYMIEHADASRDNERMVWRLHDDGNAILL